MELREGFKNLVAMVSSLDKQLLLCEQANHECNQSGFEAEKEIEEHFAMCVNALASRKATLLREVTEKIANHTKFLEETRVKLLLAIESCNQVLRAGSLTYEVSPSTADTIWQTQANMPAIMHSGVRKKITTNLQASLLNSIGSHGEVRETVLASSFCWDRVEVVETLAGSSRGNMDGCGATAKFYNPCGICVNPQDQCLYVTDCDSNAVKKITMQGEVRTFLSIVKPSQIAMNYKQNAFYVVNSDNVISKIASGTVSVYAGTTKTGLIASIGSAASFSYLRGMTVDQQTGDLYVCDNHVIRKISSTGVVSTLAGSQQGYSDGNKNTAKFSFPYALAFVEEDQSLLVADSNNSKVRRITSNGDVSTICEVPYPVGIAISADKTILVTAGGDSHKLFRVRQNGQSYEVVLLAGNGKERREDGKPEQCSFHHPRGIAVHEASHTCYIADLGNHAIRKVSFALTQCGWRIS